MKLIALLCLLALPAAAQTYCNYTVGNSDATYPATNQFDVPSNTLFKVEGMAGDYSYLDMLVQYHESTNWLYLPVCDSSATPIFSKVLGPAKIQLVGYNAEYGPVVLLASFTPVNTTPDLSGYGVQPNGRVATVALETSTNLTTWQATTNGTYAATNRAAFYRLKLEVN
ncbi:MAG TPA: hypothetical protein VGO57_02395 [Verrucomicrobiae bacterium]|jgi:hypothetical protein